MRLQAQRVGSLASAFALVVLLGACSPLGTACPAIGYFSTLEVNRGAGLAADAGLEACVGTECVSTLTEPSGGGSIETIGTTGWRISYSPAPAEVVLRAIDAANATLATTTVTLKWTRVGGSEACGGPMAAKPVTLNP